MPGSARRPSANEAGELPLDVRLALGQLVAAGKPIPAEWALAWVVGHPETRLRTPARRCPDEFRQLFVRRYQEKFGSGMTLKPNKRRLKVSHQPSSASFGGPVDVPFDNVPDVGALTRPVRLLREIAENAMSELEGYSRLVGRCPEKARRKLRFIGRGQVGAGRVYQVVSGHAACATVPRPHVRWLGEPPPRRSDRVSPGGESGPPGIPGPSAASPDRRPASATRCARPQTRPASPQVGRGHRHPGHDPSLVPETDRQEIRRSACRRRGRPMTRSEVAALVVRMAVENPQWGYTRNPRRALEPRAHDRPGPR